MKSTKEDVDVKIPFSPSWKLPLHTGLDKSKIQLQRTDMLNDIDVYHQKEVIDTSSRRFVQDEFQIAQVN